MPNLTAGTTAPEFSLHVTPDQRLSLSKLRGKAVVLAFYPADGSPVCGGELSVFNGILPELHKYNAELVAISVDGAMIAFAKHKLLHFPLLSDSTEGRDGSRLRRLSRSRRSLRARTPTRVPSSKRVVAPSMTSPTIWSPEMSPAKAEANHFQ
jgi:hypothetical protein